MLRFRWITLCYLLATIALLSACSAKPESTIQAFYKAVAAGNVDKAIEQVSFAGVEAKEMTSAKGKLQMIIGEMKKQIDANNGLKQAEIINSSVDGDKASVQVKIIFNNGKDTTGPHDLVCENGKWKIVVF